MSAVEKLARIVSNLEHEGLAAYPKLAAAVAWDDDVTREYSEGLRAVDADEDGVLVMSIAKNAVRLAAAAELLGRMLAWHESEGRRYAELSTLYAGTNRLADSLSAAERVTVHRQCRDRLRAELATTRAAEAERLLNEIVDRVREFASGATKTVGWRCGWCGIDVGTVADADQGVEAGRAHSVACEKNPLVAQLAALQNCGADHATSCGGCVDGWRAVAEKERARAEKAERQALAPADISLLAEARMLASALTDNERIIVIGNAATLRGDREVRETCHIAMGDLPGFSSDYRLRCYAKALARPYALIPSLIELAERLAKIPTSERGDDGEAKVLGGAK